MRNNLTAQNNMQLQISPAPTHCSRVLPSHGVAFDILQLPWAEPRPKADTLIYMAIDVSAVLALEVVLGIEAQADVVVVGSWW